MDHPNIATAARRMPFPPTSNDRSELDGVAYGATVSQRNRSARDALDTFRLSPLTNPELGDALQPVCLRGNDPHVEARCALRDLGDDASPAEIDAWVCKALGPLLSELRDSAEARDAVATSFTRGLFVRLAKVGLLAYLLPVSAGGLGGNRRVFGLILEALGRHCSEVELPSLVSLFADLPGVLLATRRRDLLERYVLPMSLGICLPAFAYTEQCDVGEFTTRVRYLGDRCVISGEKGLVTGGELADVFLTYVQGEDGLELFLIERDDPGVEVIPVQTMGFRAAGMARLVLRDVWLTRERRIVESDGLGQVQRFLNDRRLFVVSSFPGRMEAIATSCARQLSLVIRDGLPLTEAKNIQARLGRMVARTEAARAALHRALDHWVGDEHNEVFDSIVAAAKYWITELAIKSAEDAIRMSGWRGYSNALPYERDLRSFMGAISGQTAQEKLEMFLGVNFVARALMGGNSHNGGK